MTRRFKFPLLAGITIWLSSCISNVDSDLQTTINRDDRLLQEFFSRNNIDPIETQLGYFYTKEIANESGAQIVNNNIIGVYYEIRTIDGQLIEDYTDESKDPRIYHHTEGGLIPRAMNFASGLAKIGETFILYIPSYLAYQEYNYQQLILPNANLVIRVKYVEVYSEEEIEVIEEQLILDYFTKNNLEGFEKTSDGIYVKTIKEGNTSAVASKNGDVVSFTYKLFQLDSNNPFAQSTNNSPIQITVGNDSNLKFLNYSLKGVKKGSELEVLAPSDLGFGSSNQVFPFVIRTDLFEKGYLNQVARPFEPILFKVTILDVR